MSRAPTLGRADARPRIHIFPQPAGVVWAIGPTGLRTRADTPGAAVMAALDQVDARSGFVVIGEIDP